MTLPSNIRVNVSAPFPGRVTGANFIIVSKSNGIWTVEADYLGLVPLVAASDQALVAVYDPASQAFYSATLADIAGIAQQRSSRIVTSGATIAVDPNDADILVSLSSPAPVTVNLGAAASAQTYVSIKDYAGNASSNNITINPSGAETIDGAASALIGSDWGALTLYPLPGIGWYLK